MSQPIRGLRAHFGFPGRPSCFFWSSQKHKLGRGRWDLTSLHISMKIYSAVSEENSKMSPPIRGLGGRPVLPIGPKNTNLEDDNEILLPVKFHWIPFSGVIKEMEIISANQTPGRQSCFFFDRPKNTNLVEDVEILLPCIYRWKFIQRFQMGIRKRLSQSEAWAAILFFRSARQNLAEDVEILLPVKFHWLLFSLFKEVENSSANKRPWRQTQTLKMTLRSCFLKFGWIPFSSVIKELEIISANQWPGWPLCLVFFSDCPQKGNLIEDVEILLRGLTWCGFESR